jgi:RNA polymerase sigma factor (sigma-70 family)
MHARDERQGRFAIIYEATYSRVAAFARRRASEADADDVIAETFLVAWRRLDDVPLGEGTLPWLYGVTRRVLSQRMRSTRRRDRLLARLGRVGSRDVEEISEAETLDDREVVRMALSRLRPDDQELLRLAEWEDLPAQQLAQIFKCSTNAIAIRLHRAHKRFAEALKALDGESVSPSEQETSQ